MSDRLHVGTRKGLFTVQRSADGWKVDKVDFLGDQVPMLLHDRRDGHLYAAVGHGHFGSKMHRSADGGKTWKEIAAPKYPPKPDDWEERPNPANNNRLTEWNLELIWALEGGGPKQPGLLWCGTLPGGLFRSTDRGDSWELIRTLWMHERRREWFGGGAEHPGIHSICVDPRDANRVTLGISCGGAWRTTDGGTSWNCVATGMRAEYMPPDQQFEPNIQDPHRIVQCPAAPNVWWAQHHNGIFRSTNDCEKWEEIKSAQPSHFGFGVVVHPAKPDTAWFVPGVKDEMRFPVDGKLVVSRTRDGGKSFEVLRSGLPQAHAYDLVYRHALDIDATGERLAFGSTTGNMWVSENQGDAWKAVTSHLPPVFCVRFA